MHLKLGLLKDRYQLAGDRGVL